MEIAPYDVVSVSNSSSTTNYTPKTSSAYEGPSPEHVLALWKPNPIIQVSDVPYQDKTFLILEQSTRRALTHTCHGLRVTSLEDDGSNPRNTWFCVNRNNYMGFINKDSRCFLGHDGGSRVHAVVNQMGDWECFVPKMLPDGGYQILSPFWHSHMRLVVVADRDGGVERADYGDTTWIFEEV